ncbi:MAG: AMP-binding enzyme [Caldimonas sp.]
MPVAFVVKQPGCEISADAVRALLQSSLSRYKQPREIVFRVALPRNAMGKVVRADLRRLALTTSHTVPVDPERVHPVDRT